MPTIQEFGTLVVTPRSDLHIGSGASRPGVIDSLVVTDADGVPYIPATHLRNNLRWWAEGILEHASAQVCISGPDTVSCAVLSPDDPCVLCETFGAGGCPSRIAFSDAKPHPLLTEVLKEPGLGDLRSHLLAKRMHVSLDGTTGSQVSGRLYSNELAIAGIPYVARITRASGRPAAVDPMGIADLIWLAGSAIPALGKRRRRGYGEVTVAFAPSAEIRELGWSPEGAAERIRRWYA